MSEDETTQGCLYPNEQSPRVKIRIQLDEDVIKYFKSIENSEEKINQILRSHVEASKASQ